MFEDVCTMPPPPNVNNVSKLFMANGNFKIQVTIL